MTRRHGDENAALMVFLPASLSGAGAVLTACQHWIRALTKLLHGLGDVPRVSPRLSLCDPILQLWIGA
jgi:hypothetical protein